MAEQLYKRFTDEQVKALLKRYTNREIQVHYMLEILGIKRRRFFYAREQIFDRYGRKVSLPTAIKRTKAC